MANVIKKLRGARKEEKGSFLIEFVMILPFIICIIGFVMTVGQGMLAKNIVQNAAFQSARMAVVKTDQIAAKNIAISTAEDITSSIINQTPNDLDVTMTTNTGGWAKGDVVTCTVKTSFKPLFPFLGKDKMDVTGQMSMMVENEE